MVDIQKSLTQLYRSIPGFACIVVFYGLGEGLRHLTGIPIPGSVLGMALLFFSLSFFADALPNSTAQAGHRLIRLLALLLLPASVGIFFLPPEFNHQLPAIIGAIVLGTIISMILTTLLLKCLLQKTPLQQDD